MSVTRKIKLYRSNKRLIMEVNDDNKEIGIDLDYVINDNDTSSEDGKTVTLINKVNTDQRWEVVFGGIVDETDTTVGSTKELISSYLSEVTKSEGGSGGGGSGGLNTQSATLLKTGQTTSYRTGDDGDVQAGRASDFFTLPGDNPFGNTNRFTDELGGQTYTNDIVIDWSTYDGSTVLGYYRNAWFTNYNWNTAIDTANALSVGSYTSGWRMANIKEIENVLLRLGGLALNYAPFSITNSLWSSTSYFASSLAWFVIGAGVVNATSKTSLHRLLPVRTFTVSGTTLT